MKRKFAGLGILAAMLIAVSLFEFSVKEDIEIDDQNQKLINNQYRVYALNIPDKAEFSGENVPLNILDVRERLDRELLVNTYWQSQGLLFFKRAHKYFPEIEKILKKRGVPDDFKYLALIESGLENVVSPSGAAGFWQLMKGTATDNGLEVTNIVDERYDYKKSTEAACNYILKAKEKFGSWTMAAASYNMGINGLGKQIERQKVSNYYDLLLNEETKRYVFRIVALKSIYENPKNYGFHFRDSDLYTMPATKLVEVDSSISNLADFAINQGINYKDLKLFNPWLRDISLENTSGKKYLLEIPIY